MYILSVILQPHVDTHLFQSIKSEDSLKWNIIQVAFVTYKEKGAHLQCISFPNNKT